MKLFILCCLCGVFLKSIHGQKQEFAEVRYAVEGKEVSLPCAVPSDATFLKWVFQKNNTDFYADAAQVFPGRIPSVFTPFNSPSGRSELKGGSFLIHQIDVMEEGYYWCEVSFPGVPSVKSTKYPVHVYVTPQKPQVTALRNSTLTEHKNATVARCASQGGKPGSKLVWMNGSTPMSNEEQVIYRENAFKNYLTDADVDLRINNPTRFDHQRVFSCIIDHPAYDEKKVLNYSINVLYHPINIRVWANLTSLKIYCEAEGYPEPSYYWELPGGLTGFQGPELFIQDLFELPGQDSFVCIASNGIAPNATLRVQVDDLRYPDGIPGFLGLDWWIWGAIIGGVVAAITIIIIVICVCRRQKSAGKSKKKPIKSAMKKPIVKSSDYRTQEPPSSLPIDPRNRTPDGREDSFDSRTPSPINEHKQALIDNAFGRSREDITLIPSADLHRSRENVYSDNRRSMHASREQLDMAAGLISTLNKSWDQLSKSRQALNETQDELEHTDSSLRKSREALNRDTDQNYPYIDDDSRSRENFPAYDDRSQDRHDGYRERPPAYDYDQDHYHRGQGYGSQRYDDRQQGYDSYDRQYGDHYRDDYDRGDTYNSYNQDSRYDDRGYDYRNDQGYYRDDGHQQNDGYRQRDGYETSRIM